MSGSLSAARAGCGEGVETWVADFQPELHRHLVRMLGNAADADDVLQQVWVAALRSPPDTGDGSNVRAWLYRVATNRALDCLAKSRRRRTSLRRQDPALVTAEPAAVEARAFALNDGARDRIRAHASRLPRKQREAVWMRWVDGLDYQTIAQRLDSSPESARANVYHGMKRLRAELKDLWEKEYGS